MANKYWSVSVWEKADGDRSMRHTAKVYAVRATGQKQAEARAVHRYTSRYGKLGYANNSIKASPAAARHLQQTGGDTALLPDTMAEDERNRMFNADWHDQPRDPSNGQWI